MSMQLRLQEPRLYVELSWWESLLSKCYSFSVPLQHIKHVEIKEESPVKFPRFEIGMRFFLFPFVARIGSFYTTQGKEFWCRKANQRILMIELEQEKYKKLILGIDNPEYWYSLLKRNSAV